ncbi:TetR/AcrR family transcriptional regulator [Acetobacter pasteurianus]|uniref:TetR/AcrR family transcriptional regulator n=1 Tax=Acetobacter pasteurianus TaxID=438 RepID=UPI0003842B75|nr:TetR/AcrR family transcriptional regulator [Acetobacter pasteurianus]QHM91877.1 TetR/AcrR family transcriptional regulator [Acetobacter pasteurianus]CCT59129.1 pyrimidine utilization regulatory protein R [Acetobacter pasteurianus 386B]
MMRKNGNIEPSVGNPRKQNTTQILDAAEKVFAVHGLSGTRIDDIAKACALPKANVLYYFNTKETLYQATLERFLADWLGDANIHLSVNMNPREGLQSYIQAKMLFSRQRPEASRLFMHELLAGGEQIQSFLRETLKPHVEDLAVIFAAWHEKGLIKKIDPFHFMFMLWAMTQSYADMQVQFAAVLGQKRLTKRDFEIGTETIMQLVASICIDAEERN